MKLYYIKKDNFANNANFFPNILILNVANSKNHAGYWMFHKHNHNLQNP